MINTEGYLEHIQKLLRDNNVPKLPEEYAEDPLFVQIHDELKTIREILFAFSSGDFSPTINIRGVIPGCLKTLQSHLCHLVWQVQMVEKGETLAVINDKLRKEVEEMESLKESEAHFKFLASHDPLKGVFTEIDP